MKRSRMMKAWSMTMSLLMGMSLCAFTVAETGCSAAQFDNAVATIQGQLPAVQALAGDLGTLTGDPAVAIVAQTVSSVVSADLPLLQKAVTAYQANKSSGTKNALFAAVNTLTTNVNAQVLAANKVLNAQSQAATLQKIAAIGAVVNGFQLVLAPFFNQSAQAQAKSAYLQVAPYIPRQEQERVAEMYGYRLGQLGL